MIAVAGETIREQLAFLAELDQLKSVVRQSPLINRTRKENSAEHSWHLAMFSLVLSEYGADVDQAKVVQMLLIHDIVEIGMDQQSSADRRSCGRRHGSLSFSILARSRERLMPRLGDRNLSVPSLRRA